MLNISREPLTEEQVINLTEIVKLNQMRVFQVLNKSLNKIGLCLVIGELPGG